jgi:hypothetical protein
MSQKFNKPEEIQRRNKYFRCWMPKKQNEPMPIHRFYKRDWFFRWAPPSTSLLYSKLSTMVNCIIECVTNWINIYIFLHILKNRRCQLSRQQEEAQWLSLVPPLCC